MSSTILKSVSAEKELCVITTRVCTVNVINIYNNSWYFAETYIQLIYYIRNLLPTPSLVMFIYGLSNVLTDLQQKWALNKKIFPLSKEQLFKQHVYK